MAIKSLKPNTSARRHMTVANFSSIQKNGRDKSLTIGKNRISGRSGGKMVVAHRGGGAKRLYRLVDFKRLGFIDQEGTVQGVEYDPNRTAYIAKVKYGENELGYIIATEGMKTGDKVICAEDAAPQAGNCLKLKNIPPSTQIHNIELTSGHGGELVRSAGGAATLMGFDGDYALVRLPSGESRKIISDNYATIGVVSNTDHTNVVIGKAGRQRWRGLRPSVRGKAMNPVDHPHGGGEGHNSIGMKYPKTPWGAPALGRRTRNKRKASSKLILNRRKK